MAPVKETRTESRLQKQLEFRTTLVEALMTLCQIMSVINIGVLAISQTDPIRHGRT